MSLTSIATVTSGYMAAVLPQGKRGMATEITVETGAGGFILPNDHVDVILSRRDKEAEKAFQFCVSLGVRLMIASSTRTGTVEEGLAGAAHKIFKDEIPTAAALKSELKDLTPTDGPFAAAFETATLSNRSSR